MRTDQIALQLWTVRDLLARDVPGTLRAVAAAGYRSVELAGLPELTTADLAAELRKAGLRPIAEHVGIDRLRADPSLVVDRLDELGCPRAIVPWLPEEERRTADDVRRFASELNSLAVLLADRAITLGYHNHQFEFAPLDSTTVWEIFLAELAPQSVLELDVYWASVGGRDPVDVINNAHGRIRLLHMKDRAPGSEAHDAPAGAGMLDMRAIVRAAQGAGVEWYVAEQDEPRELLENIATAYRNLAALPD